MEVTKTALGSALMIVVLALASADVRNLYRTPGGGELPHGALHHQALGGDEATNPAPQQGPLSSGALFRGDVESLNPVKQEASDLINRIPNNAGAVESLSSFGVEESSSGSIQNGNGRPQQGTMDQFSAQGFDNLFQGDIRSQSQGFGQQQEDTRSGVDSFDRQQFVQQQQQQGIQRESAPSVQQQNGGLMFSSGNQGGDASVSDTFPGAALHLDNTLPSGTAQSLAAAGADARIFPSSAEVTLTREVTVDRFTTLTNLAYNSVPVTLTEFMKITLTAPTFQAITTPVDDIVLVSRVPVSRTDTITITDTNSAYQYATDVSTVLYTVTHKLYDIRQQTVTSLVVQTQLVRPRIVSTRIETEYETQTQLQTITNTVVLDPQDGRLSPVFSTRHGHY